MKTINKQPFYHRLEVSFTATSNVAAKLAILQGPNSRSISKFEKALCDLIVKHGGKAVLGDTISIEICDAEPGDPADLVG